MAWRQLKVFFYVFHYAVNMLIREFKVKDYSSNFSHRFYVITRKLTKGNVSSVHYISCSLGNCFSLCSFRCSLEVLVTLYVELYIIL